MFEKFNRVKILEYKILWTSLGIKELAHKGFDIDILFVSQKEILIHHSIPLRKLDFYPVFDQLSDQTSTRLLLHSDSANISSSNYIDIEPYFKSYNYISSNDILNFGYKSITRKNTS